MKGMMMMLLFRLKVDAISLYIFFFEWTIHLSLLLSCLWSCSIHKEKNHSLIDITVQVVLKQGQVSTEDVTAEDSDFILLHRNVVEELNKTIRVSIYY